jgi:hypothetical protein
MAFWKLSDSITHQERNQRSHAETQSAQGIQEIDQTLRTVGQVTFFIEKKCLSLFPSAYNFSYLQ